LTVTDSPPTNVSILSAEVTITGATLDPGNVPLLVSPVTLELTRLRTDVAYLSTTSVNAGSYTSLTLTFSNPRLTIENDTGSPLATGGSNPACSAGAICTIQPVTTNLSTTITPLTFTVTANIGAGLLVDVNLDNLLSATLGADFKNGTTVSQFTPGGSGAPLVGAEDVVGQTSSVNTTNNTFSLQNAVGTVSLLTDSTTTFFQFPTSVCATPGFACLHNGQILSVDISLGADGKAVARNVVFEDIDSSDTEVEGIITSTNAGSLQFTIVTLAESAAITTLPIGTPATVSYTVSTLSDVDFIHADNAQVDTSGYLFSVRVPADLIVGQQVQVRRNPTTSSGTSITADRVLLRSSRVSGSFQSGVTSLFNLSSLPSLFSRHAIPQIQVKTSVPTICAGTVSSCSLLAATHRDSVRGPLFANSGSPVLIASKVLQR
jgi:hypothetical protein